MYKEAYNDCRLESTACTEAREENEQPHHEEEESEEIINNQDNVLEMSIIKEEGNNTNESQFIAHGENKFNSHNGSSVSLSEALEPFSVLQNSYHGSHESIKCIDIDVEAKRVYAASWSEGVFVWDLYSHKPIAVLRHQSWVNTLKCFPSLSISNYKEEKIQTSRTVKQKCSERGLCTKTVYVLTGCEDGVLSAWDAVTFSVHARLKLSLNPISAIYIEPEKIDRETIRETEFSWQDCTSSLMKENRKCNDISGNKQNSDDANNVNNYNNNKIDNTRSKIDIDKGNLIKNDRKTGGRAYVAAMHHIFVLWVDTSLTLIHDLIHPTECLCVTLLVSSVTTYLIVGQENGQLICWNSSNWEYADTLEYPGDEIDVNRDCLQGNSIHQPKLDVMTGQLQEESFEYNKLRYDLHINKNNANAHSASSEQSNSSKKHRVTIKGQTYFTEGVELQQECEERDTDNDISEKVVNDHDNDKTGVQISAATTSNGKPFRKIQETGEHLAEEIEKLMHTKEDVSYDDRRVTCLATNDTLIKTSLCNLYSGHANGVLLIWQSPFPNMPIVLMKKLHLFPHNAWVQTLVTMPIITYTETVKHEKASTNKNATKSEAAIATKEAEPVTKTKQKSKKSKIDAKDGIYSKLTNEHLQKAKASQNIDKHTKTQNKKEKTEAKNHKICNRNDKHSASEIKESEYLFACSDHGAVKYLKVDNDNVSRADGPGILAYSACCWTDHTTKQQNSESASVETKQTNLPTNVYVAMGNFDGRLERYDVTAVIDRLQKQC